MALGIPLPGQPGDAFLGGLNSGSTMWSRMMQDRNQKAQMQQQQAQHAQNLALQRDQLARLQQMDPYQRHLLEAQTQKAFADAQKSQMLQNILSGLGGIGDQGGEMPLSGMNTLSSGDQQRAQPHFSPLQAQVLKAMTGIDVFAESPEMKSDRVQKEFERREQYKFNQPKSALTTTAQNQAQEEMMRIDKLMPDLQFLQNLPPQKLTLLGTSADKQYGEMLFSLADSLVKAKSLPQTDSSIKKQMDVLKIGVRESPQAYKARLKRLEQDLLERRNKNLEFLQKGNVMIDQSQHGDQSNVLRLTDKDL